MPVQAPQWTEFLTCPVCFNAFNGKNNIPVSLGCGHTICRACLRTLHQKICPFEQIVVSLPIDQLPVNTALLKLIGVSLEDNEDCIPSSLGHNLSHFKASRKCIEDIVSYLKNGTGTPNNKAANNVSLATAHGALSRPMLRKLVTLVNCQLVEEEGRARALRSARSLGDRTVTELILLHQNPQQLSANLWAAVRARGCQFLGPAMQEEVLKLIVLALENGSALSRKVLVLFVVQRLETQYPQASKTAIGHVVQLLYRASCFKVTKRDDESSLMQLKEEFCSYETLRREHDSQIVQIATEAGLRIAPEQWSSLLYGDGGHKSHMQSIIDKLQTPQSFAQSVNELVIALQRTGDPANLARLRPQLDLMTSIDPSPDAPPPSWENLEAVLKAVKTLVDGLVEFTRNHSHKKYESTAVQSLKYKTSMCRDLVQRGSCPRGGSCTFAHSEEEMDRYRSRNKKWAGKVATMPTQNSREQPDLVTKETRTKLTSREVATRTIKTSPNQQPEHLGKNPLSSHQMSPPIPIPASRMSQFPVSQVSPPVVLPSSMPVSQAMKAMSYTMPHPHDLVHKSIGRPRMSSFEVPTVEGLTLHSPVPPAESPVYPITSGQRAHYEPPMYPPCQHQTIPRATAGMVGYHPGMAPYPQLPHQGMPAYSQVPPGIGRYRSQGMVRYHSPHPQRMPPQPQPECIPPPPGAPAYPMMPGYLPPGSEYATEGCYHPAQQLPWYGYDHPQYWSVSHSGHGGTDQEDDHTDHQTGHEQLQEESLEQLERRRTELLTRLRNKHSTTNTLPPPVVEERTTYTELDSQQQQEVVDAIISSCTTTAYNDIIWSTESSTCEDDDFYNPWSTGDRAGSNSSTVVTEDTPHEQLREREGSYAEVLSQAHAPLSSLSFVTDHDDGGDFGRSYHPGGVNDEENACQHHHGDDDDDDDVDDGDDWSSKDFTDFQHLISQELFTTIDDPESGRESMTWTYNSLNANTDIIPFTDKPTVSRFGPISRGQRNETNVKNAKPVQVTASQGRNSIPSTAVTPIQRPFPAPHAVPSRYPPNPFGLAEVEQMKNTAGVKQVVVKKIERIQSLPGGSSDNVAKSQAEREQLKLEIKKIDAKIIQAAESGQNV